MNNLIDIFISYKTNCLIKYGLLIYNKDNKFIKDVFATYFKTYIDNYYYDIFHTVDVLEFNEEVLKKEFIGCMEELLDEYRNYELQVSNEEYSNNVKIIKELKDISYEITKMDLLNYKDRETEYIDGNYYQPTFLYESILDLLGFIVLSLTRFYPYLKVGFLTGLYLIWYGATRFFVEGMRSYSLMLGPIKMAQVVSIIMILCGIYFCFIRNIKTKKFENLYQEGGIRHEI